MQRGELFWAMFGIVPVVILVVGLGVARVRSQQRRRTTAAGEADVRTTGAKARAMVVNVRFGGVIENRVDYRTVVDFRLEPLDGGAPFAASKTMTFNQVDMPRPGEVWPAWYDAADHARFSVDVPNGLSEIQIPLYREFGIPHPLDKG